MTTLVVPNELLQDSILTTELLLEVLSRPYDPNAPRLPYVTWCHDCDAEITGDAIHSCSACEHELCGDCYNCESDA